MGFFVCKGNDFCFYTRAISGTDTLYLPVEKGRIFQSGTQSFVRLRIGIGDPTRHLFEFSSDRRKVRELMPIIVAVLPNHLVEMDRTCIYACRRTGLHSVALESEFYQLFGYPIRCRFRDTSAFDLGLTAMHESVQECTVG